MDSELGFGRGGLGVRRHHHQHDLRLRVAGALGLGVRLDHHLRVRASFVGGLGLGVRLDHHLRLRFVGRQWPAAFRQENSGELQLGPFGVPALLPWQFCVRATKVSVHLQGACRHGARATTFCFFL